MDFWVVAHANFRLLDLLAVSRQGTQYAFVNGRLILSLFNDHAMDAASGTSRTSNHHALRI
jgi:hypothetical protein